MREHEQIDGSARKRQIFAQCFKSGKVRPPIDQHGFARRTHEKSGITLAHIKNLNPQMPIGNSPDFMNEYEYRCGKKRAEKKDKAPMAVERLPHRIAHSTELSSTTPLGFSLDLAALFPAGDCAKRGNADHCPCTGLRQMISLRRRRSDS